MKRLLILALIIVGCALGTLAYAFVNINFLIASYKSDLEKMASNAIGAKVALGELRASIFPNTAIKVSQVNVGAELGFKDFSLQVNLIPLLSKQLEISELVMERPNLKVIRTKNGIVIPGLSNLATTNVEQQQTANSGKKVGVSNASAASGFRVNLERFRINDASLTFEDDLAKNEYLLSHIDIGGATHLSDTELHMPDFKFAAILSSTLPFSAQSNDITYNLQNKFLVLKSMDLQALAGKISGTLSLNTQSQQFSTKIEAKQVKIEELLKAIQPKSAESVIGLVQNLKLNFQGGFKSNLVNGSARLDLSDGSLIGFNLGGAVLKAIKLPFLPTDLISGLPQTTKTLFSAEDTKIDKLLLDADVNAGIINIEKLTLLSNIGLLESRGAMKIDGELNLDATLSFAKEISEELASKTKELKGLMDSNGQLVIPLSIQGKLPKPMVLPNIQKLLESQAGAIIGDKAEKLIEGLLGNKEKSSDKPRLKDLFKF